MSELHALTVKEIREGLDTKDFSALEVTKAFLERSQQNKDLNSYIDLWQDEAITQAEAADKKIAAGESATLLGVPIAVKDVLTTKYGKTTCGSKILEGFSSPYDATAIAKLYAAGAIILGKTNMDEFAMGSSNENSAFGAVKNPWNSEYVPGGSSGGSAAAVSARLAPVALGSDTGGSIRQPASYCNICGLKPTYGRISRYGLVAFASSFDQVGPLAQDAYDCALLCQALSGHDVKDSTSMPMEVPDFAQNLNSSIDGLKIGIPKEYFIDGLSIDVEKKVRDAISELKNLGTKIVDISLPHTEAAIAAYYILTPAEASSNLSRYDGIRYGHRCSAPEDLQDLYCKSRTEGFGKEVKRRILIGTYVLSSGYYDAYYRRAQKVRTLIAKDFSKVFEKDCDLILCPTTPSAAFKIGENVKDPLAMYLNDIFTIPLNLAGLPGISIPCGFNASNMPIGMQLIGKAWDEQTLLNTAYAYQTVTDWHKQKPAI